MVKRALCVGCNYPSKAFGLAGAVNDAFMICECLQAHCGFLPENICLLHDMVPGQRKTTKVEAAKMPTRVNILQQLQWLVRSSRPGDVLFFSFSGYGLQVDDMEGHADEGYDEAILPTDFVEGRDGGYSVIVAADIHDVLMGTPQFCTVTVLMDCDHATSIIDVAGTLDGQLVGGLKFNGFCGLKAHNIKMQLGNHDRGVWQEDKAKSVKARPRFQPVMEIENPRKGRLPTRPSMSRSSPVAFGYSAASFDQTAMELQMTVLVDGKETQRQHGCLSWAFVQGLDELKYRCTHVDLLQAIRRILLRVKEQDLPKMDQEVLLTFALPNSEPVKMRVFEPLEVPNSWTGWPGSGRFPESEQSLTRPIVPPPQPGTITAERPPDKHVSPVYEISGKAVSASFADPFDGPSEPWPRPPPRVKGDVRRGPELVHHLPFEDGASPLNGIERPTVTEPRWPAASSRAPAPSSFNQEHAQPSNPPTTYGVASGYTNGVSLLRMPAAGGTSSFANGPLGPPPVLAARSLLPGPAAPRTFQLSASPLQGQPSFNVHGLGQGSPRPAYSSFTQPQVRGWPHLAPG